MRIQSTCLFLYVLQSTLTRSLQVFLLQSVASLNLMLAVINLVSKQHLKDEPVGRKAF